MKQKTNREKENEKTRGKKRFIERVAEEKEAEQQIKEFDRNEDITDEGRTRGLDGFGPIRQ
jgi:hypothetical protein